MSLKAEFLKRKELIFEATGAVITVILCFNFASLFRSVYFYTFMSRDLDRAAKLLEGQPIFFGPETSGGGHLPGPLIYIILAIPLFFYPLWQSCFFLLMNFLSGMALAGWAWIRRHFDAVTGFAFLAMLALSYPLRSYVLLFLNVSYMLPFAFAGILAGCAAFSSPDPRHRRRAFLLSSLMIGLGWQLHGSILCLLLALLFMQFAAPKISLERVAWRDLGHGLLLIAACVAPYHIWRAFSAMGMTFGQQGSYVGKAPGSLKTLFMLAQYSSDVPFETTMQEISLRIFAIVPLVLLAATAAYTANALYEKVRGIPHPELEPNPVQRKFFRALLWVMAWGFFPFSYVFVVHMGRRYGMVFCLSLIVAGAIVYGRVLRSRRATVIYNFIAATVIGLLITVYFGINPKAAVNMLGKTRNIFILAVPLVFVYRQVMTSSRYPIAVLLSLTLTLSLALLQRDIVAPRGLREKKVPRFHNEDWIKIWKTILLNTGWDYDTAIQRIFFVNLRLDEDPRFGFEQVSRRSRFLVSRDVKAPDGFFVLNTKFLKKKGHHSDHLRFINEQRIPQEIKDALRDGDLVLGEPMYEGTMVIPYYVKNLEKLPPYFHNLGLGYRRSDRETDLEKIPGTEGTAVLDDGSLLYKWNDCPDLNSFCSTGAHVYLPKTAGKKGEIEITVEAIGSAISQNSPWISPSWTQAWIEPYVEVRCGGEPQRRILFSSIGLMRKYGSNEFNEVLQANNSLVAPMRRIFKFKCSGPLTEVTVGRAGSAVEHLASTSDLPARALSIRLEPPRR